VLFGTRFLSLLDTLEPDKSITIEGGKLYVEKGKVLSLATVIPVLAV
jgi:hypothetical protein